jgi:hypothetical protein
LNTDVRRYEGLVRATANRIAPFVEMPLEDIEQRLRIKVWRALVTFDSAIGRPEDQYVLSCVFNEKKDILALRRRGELPLDAMLTPEDRKRNRGEHRGGRSHAPLDALAPGATRRHPSVRAAVPD